MSEQKERIHLSDYLTYRKILKFVLPSVIMMIFTSIYGVVDGFFVSRFVGKTAFASINLVTPVLTILGTLGVMIGTGGVLILPAVFGLDGIWASIVVAEIAAFLLTLAILIMNRKRYRYL